MLSIAVCDDEALIRRALIDKARAYLRQSRVEGQVIGFASGEELLRRPGNFDLVLLDIEMAATNGMRVAETLRERGDPCEILFITSHASYVFDAFRVRAANFLVKPIADEKFDAAMADALRRVRGEGDAPFLLVKRGNELLKVRLRDILYGEAMNHKVQLHTTHGAIDYYENIAALAKRLGAPFFRCHRSFLVNLDHVVAFQGDTVAFADGSRALVSRRKAAELSERILETVRKEGV